MPIVRSLVVLLALASPAFAQDGANDAADAGVAAQAFRVYVEGVSKKGGRPDLSRPEVAALLGRVFNLDALAALPPTQASDVNWLLDWTGAANATHKLFAFYGAKPGPQPDLAAVTHNMSEYEDQYAVAVSFMIRATARDAVALRLFMAELLAAVGSGPRPRTARRPREMSTG